MSPVSTNPTLHSSLVAKKKEHRHGSPHKKLAALESAKSVEPVLLDQMEIYEAAVKLIFADKRAEPDKMLQQIENLTKRLGTLVPTTQESSESLDVNKAAKSAKRQIEEDNAVRLRNILCREAFTRAKLPEMELDMTMGQIKKLLLRMDNVAVKNRFEDSHRLEFLEYMAPPEKKDWVFKELVCSDMPYDQAEAMFLDEVEEELATTNPHDRKLRKRHFSGDIKKYHKEFRYLISRASDHYTPQHLCDFYVDGLSEDLRQTIRLAKPQTHMQAYKLAVVILASAQPPIPA